MSLEIKGLNSLIAKLNNLSNIKGMESVEQVTDMVERSIRNSASSFSNVEANYIGRCDVRKYESGSYFVDIGLKGSKAPFELWKGLWFHNWGYNLKYYGHPTNTYINMHSMWFDNAVNNIDKQALQCIKGKLRSQIKACLEG